MTHAVRYKDHKIGHKAGEPRWTRGGTDTLMRVMADFGYAAGIRERLREDCHALAKATGDSVTGNTVIQATRRLKTQRAAARGHHDDQER